MNSIVIYDAEYWTDKGCLERNWQGPNDKPPYLVQLSATKVALEPNLKEVEKLSVYVSPVDVNGNSIQLTNYFEMLTHITESKLKQNAIPIPDAFKQMKAFFGNHLCFSYGGDETKIKISATDWQQPMPMAKANCRDVRDLLRKGGMKEEDIKSNSSGMLAQFHNLPFTGHVHDASDDVQSIITTLRHYLKEGKLTLNDFN